MGLSFLEAKANVGFNEAKYIILPLPYDATASWGAGARFGPERILLASKELELFDEELLTEPFKAGIHTLPSLDIPIPPKDAYIKIEKTVHKIISSSKMPISLGGDHSVSFGAIKAIKKKYNNLSVLQLDAHTDLRESYQGTSLSHACIIRNIWDFCQVVQAGIRSVSKAEWQFLKAHGLEPIWARDIHDDLNHSIKKIISNIENSQLYITIDVDCLDPSIMPATGTPEPGGLNWLELISILKEVCKNFEIVGFDVVELSPIPSFHHPEFTVARLIYKLIGYIEAFKN